AARRSAGVAALLTGDEARRLCKPCRGILQHYQGMKSGAMLPLAVERVRYAGEPIVAVAGETRAAAADAVALVRVGYRPLPAVLSPATAVAPDAPLIHPDLGDNVIYEARLAGADADGTLTGMRARIVAAVGPYSAFPRSSVVEGGQVLRLLPGPYRLRHYDGALSVVAQNKVVTSQYRAVGHPIAAAVTESLLDQIARDLRLDPAEVRRRNLVRPADLPCTS